jgi:hypothetical protein
MRLKLIFNILALSVGFLIAKSPLHADFKGRVELSPTYVHMDILESGVTIERMDLMAIKADATISHDCGLTLKPTFLYGSNSGGLILAGVGLGQYIPINDTWKVMPMIGISYCKIWTSIDFHEFELTNLREKFYSLSPYIGGDVYYNFAPTWRACVSVQYAWSRTKTTIELLGTDKSHTQGPNYAAMIEKDLNDEWSVNLGVGYNIGLSKEKHGLRATGIKLGIARWF